MLTELINKLPYTDREKISEADYKNNNIGLPEK